ncbi:hypothetical protein KAJ27_17765 [bacterium]|nr:hypothetical protein [bacterium]
MKKTFSLIFAIFILLSNLNASAEFFDLPDSNYEEYIMVWGKIEYGSSVDRSLDNVLRRARTVLRYSWRDRYWFNRIRYLTYVLVIPKKKLFNYQTFGFKKLNNVSFEIHMSRRSNMGRGIGRGQIYISRKQSMEFKVDELVNAFKDIASALIKKPFETYEKFYPDDIKALRKRPENIIKWEELGYGFQYSFEITTIDSDTKKKIRLFKTSRLKEQVRY